MLSPRTIPTLISGATLASALMLGPAIADPSEALGWSSAPETGAIQSFGGDAMTAEPVISEGDGEPAPSPLSGAPAARDDEEMPLASQIGTGPGGATSAVFSRGVEES